MLGVQLSDVVVRSTAEIEGAFSAIDQAGAEAVVVLLGNTFFSRQQLLADLALQHRLPSMFGAREHVAAGGLLSYAANQVDLFRRAAIYVDKILRGANPAVLPVEQPTVFNLAVNLKTAQALGITIPQSVLAQATEIIQ